MMWLWWCLCVNYRDGHDDTYDVLVHVRKTINIDR